MSESERPWDAPKPKPTPKRAPTSSDDRSSSGSGGGTQKFWLRAATAALIIGLVGWCSVETKKNMDERDTNGDERGAISACQTFVENRLKSPGSADFSSETATMDEATKVWTVTGIVDSDNSFGASVRNGYRCETSHQGDDNWDLVDLETDGN